MRERAELFRQLEIIHPRGPGRARVRPGVSGARHALAPFSWMYGGAVAVARKRRLRRAAAGASPATVISIGNIETGGTGKTPCAIFLIEELEKAGATPVYVSRGYASAAEGFPGVTILLPANANGCPPIMPGVRIIDGAIDNLHREIGDEGAVVAGRLPRVPLLFSKRKRIAVEIACSRFSPSHIVLDDAFQTWDLHRDIDIVLLDPVNPFGRGGLIPAGTLREEPAALGRADAVGLIGEAEAADVERIRAMIERETGDEKPVFSLRRRISFATSAGAAAAAPEGTIASLSAIARPDGFDRMLLGAGCRIACSIRYPDHHRYTQDDVRWILSILSARALSTFVTTEKDWVKLAGFDFGAVNACRTVLDLDAGGADILATIQKPRPGAAVS
jgi:tetraacyldisaccharide 4'-kinase